MASQCLRGIFELFDQSFRHMYVEPVYVEPCQTTKSQPFTKIVKG